MIRRPEVQQLLLANGVIAAPGAVAQPGMCRAFPSMDEVSKTTCRALVSDERHALQLLDAVLNHTNEEVAAPPSPELHAAAS